MQVQPEIGMKLKRSRLCHGAAQIGSETSDARQTSRCPEGHEPSLTFYTAYMRFVTFQSGGKVGPGLLAPNETVIDLTAAGFPTLLDLIAGGDESRAKGGGLCRRRQAREQAGVELGEIARAYPAPEQVDLRWLELSRARSGNGATIPDVPTIFNKFATAVIGPGADIVLPKVSKSPDYEAEFAFVIGQRRPPYCRGRLAGPRLGLHHRQRRFRARLSTRHHAMADGQDVRYVRAHGSVDCNGG